MFFVEIWLFWWFSLVLKTFLFELFENIHVDLSIRATNKLLVFLDRRVLESDFRFVSREEDSGSDFSINDTFESFSFWNPL